MSKKNSKKAPKEQTSEHLDAPTQRDESEQLEPIQDEPEIIEEDFKYDLVESTYPQRKKTEAIFNSFDQSLVMDPDAPLKQLMDRMKKQLQEVQILPSAKAQMKQGLLQKEKEAFTDRFVEKKRQTDAVQNYYHGILKNDKLMGEVSIMIRYLIYN